MLAIFGYQLIRAGVFWAEAVDHPLKMTTPLLKRLAQFHQQPQPTLPPDHHHHHHPQHQHQQQHHHHHQTNHPLDHLTNHQTNYQQHQTNHPLDHLTNLPTNLPTNPSRNLSINYPKNFLNNHHNQSSVTNNQNFQSNRINSSIGSIKRPLPKPPQQNLNHPTATITTTSSNNYYYPPYQSDSNLSKPYIHPIPSSNSFSSHLNSISTSQSPLKSIQNHHHFPFNSSISNSKPLPQPPKISSNHSNWSLSSNQNHINLPNHNHNQNQENHHHFSDFSQNLPTQPCSNQSNHVNPNLFISSNKHAIHQDGLKSLKNNEQLIPIPQIITSNDDRLDSTQHVTKRHTDHNQIEKDNDNIPCLVISGENSSLPDPVVSNENLPPNLIISQESSSRENCAISEQDILPTLVISNDDENDPIDNPKIITTSHRSKSRPNSLSQTVMTTAQDVLSSSNKSNQTLNCSGCQQLIAGRIVHALQRRWHPDCFICQHCGLALEHVAFYEHDGKAYCGVDYDELFSLKCHHCNTSINDESYVTLDDPSLPDGPRHYHQLHLFCSECGDPFIDPKSLEERSKISKDPNLRSKEEDLNENLDGNQSQANKRMKEPKPFVLFKGYPYCEKCDLRLHRPKCWKCKESIKEIEFIKAIGKVWHSNCFTCFKCHEPFWNQKFFLIDGHHNHHANSKEPFSVNNSKKVSKQQIPICETCYTNQNF
ncbi:hypothetical protein O181_011272 [Austropuccinia psidii MF-1]|uniref:LIM zinc-binding domain-containing protein n=1 Tax=Austropuccinia psidii MF-1 TaxID=1389203 RepID=A0A9Q3BVE9_9BASI|nr:hypothetical protein [Austropuccinia psidii MF-1]